MLQDAVWVDADWIAEEGNEDVAIRFLTATFEAGSTFWTTSMNVSRSFSATAPLLARAIRNGS
jgi:hypothetical protein